MIVLYRRKVREGIINLIYSLVLLALSVTLLVFSVPGRRWLAVIFVALYAATVIYAVEDLVRRRRRLRERLEEVGEND